MSVASSQRQVFLRLLRPLRSRWHGDLALPAQIQRLLAGDRTFGARDRRLYRELIYTTLRYLPWVEPWLDRDPDRAAKIVAWLAAETRDTTGYRAALCADWPSVSSLASRAAFLEADAEALLPAWFRVECPAAFEPAELEAQLARAPLWLRLQTDDSRAVAVEFAENGWRVRPSALLPTAWQLLDEVDVTKATSYVQGRIEIQDLGSQLVLESIGIGHGGRWLDACAGAGGKSLQLARLLGPKGTVEAFDIRRAALEELKQRAARAGAVNLRTTSRATAGDYSGVVVDAPCSGSGTWRRAPHLKWSTTPKIVAARCALQRTLLARYAVCVRPGGWLVYATCSLIQRENEHIVQDFLSTHPGFEALPFTHTFGFQPGPVGLTILPARHDTDGFFVAALRRR